MRQFIHVSISTFQTFYQTLPILSCIVSTFRTLKKVEQAIVTDFRLLSTLTLRFCPFYFIPTRALALPVDLSRVSLFFVVVPGWMCFVLFAGQWASEPGRDFLTKGKGSGSKCAL